jgi:F-type H+-transporting ATPase subunit epsilon
VATTSLLIVTPAAKKFEGDAELVIAPGAAGDLGALPNHAPMLTTLRTGLVKANAAGGRVEFAVAGGFMEILPDRVIVLTDRAVSKDEVDVEAARADLQRAHEALAQKKGGDDSDERAALAWAQARLEVSGRGV